MGQWLKFRTKFNEIFYPTSNTRSFTIEKFLMGSKNITPGVEN